MNSVAGHMIYMRQLSEILNSELVILALLVNGLSVPSLL